MKHFVIATAGHVDHGKSSLVKALTGTDPDRLPEEKARQITIDLGFAELDLGNDIHAAIVDVPGHEDFVRNMIAGVGSIDLALLVVAADDGWMPQTEEHLQILQYLGVEHAVVALTKIDIGDADKAEIQIRDQLRNTSFADAAIVRTSLRMTASGSHAGESGFAALKTALAAELSLLEPQRDVGRPRLFVDRVFTLRGIGTVVTGTLTDGILRRGDIVAIQPRNSIARLRSLQSHGRDVDLAQPGMRTAVNLPDVDAENGISRGDIVTIPGIEPSMILDVVLQRSSRSQRVAPIKSGASVYLHHGTSRVAAKIVLSAGKELRSGETAIAQLRLHAPALAFIGDRFVVRDPSEQRTIAGGGVLDPDGEEKDFRSDAQQKLLGARAVAPEDVDLCLRTTIARRGPMLIANILHKSRFSAEEIDVALQRLRGQHEIFSDGNITADPRTWNEVRNRAMAFIRAEHRTHPERAGLELRELRARFPEQPPEVFDALLADLGSKDVVQVGSAVALRMHRPALPPALSIAATEILAGLSEKPFDPPNRKTNDPESRQALKFLIEQDKVVELATDVFLTREACAQMKSAITRFISAHGAATVSQLRRELETSRRIIVPLLELLDRQGVTRRVGDQRTLAKQSMTTSSGALD